jgi:hypothetical protein
LLRASSRRGLAAAPLRFTTLRPDQAGRDSFIPIDVWLAGHTQKAELGYELGLRKGG